MGTTATIESGIKAAIIAELGAGFTELAHSLDPTKNKFLGGTQAYGVVPGVIVQRAGVNGFVTVDQRFQIVLTESFAPPKTGDASMLAAARTLHGRLETVYTRLVRTKAGVPASVINVFDLDAEVPEYFDSNVAVLRATITIKFRTAL